MVLMLIFDADKTTLVIILEYKKNEILRTTEIIIRSRKRNQWTFKSKQKNTKSPKWRKYLIRNK